MNKGKLIVFEGMDCCGKSTQLKIANKYLVRKGFKVYCTREPGGTMLGEAIRRLLKDNNMIISKETERFMFATARQEHNVLIKKMLDEGYIVLSDRHYLTSYVYQGTDSDVIALNEAANRILVDNGYKINNLTYDLSYEDYMIRINNRNSKDRFEQKLLDEKVFNRLCESYRIVTGYEDGYFIETNNKSIDDIKKETIEIIKNILKGEHK